MRAQCGSHTRHSGPLSLPVTASRRLHLWSSAQHGHVQGSRSYSTFGRCSQHRVHGGDFNQWRWRSQRSRMALEHHKVFHSSSRGMMSEGPIRAGKTKSKTLFFLATVGFTASAVIGLVILGLTPYDRDLALIQNSMKRDKYRNGENSEPKRPKFYDFRVVAVERTTPDTFVISLKAEDSLLQRWLSGGSMRHLYLSLGKTTRSGEAPGLSWRYPMWSVDIKEPNVQIARHFTPLPLLDEPSLSGQDVLKFYVRSFPEGEMSRYLRSFKEGDKVEMRGPHPGFDLERRMGTQKNLVFLAGGTGISPGLQAADAVLKRDPNATATLLWAVRAKAETKGIDDSDFIQPSKGPSGEGWISKWMGHRDVQISKKPILDSPVSEAPLPFLINHLRIKYGHRLTVKVAVDELSSAFSQSDIQAALPQSDSSLKSPPGCPLHDQSLQIGASEAEEWQRQCQCTEEVGKNLFMISGPQGFIAKYAGSKMWSDGRERQGEVGGILGAMMKNDPAIAQRWLVLKL